LAQGVHYPIELSTASAIPLFSRTEAHLEPHKTFGISAYTIANLQLFREIDDAQLIRHLADCPVLSVPAGQVVTGNHLYIVLSGALTVGSDDQASLQDGSASKILPGESVGELAVLDEVADALCVRTLEDSELLQIDSERFWAIIDQSHGVARNMLRMLSFRIRAANAQLRRKQKVGEFYRQLSMNDALTGLYNRAWLNSSLPNMISQSHEQHVPLSIIMIDLDHFKKFNDEYGHLQGDHALRIAAEVLLAALRPSDFASRYGGEEMMVILPHTRETPAVMVAQRLCARMQEAVVFDDGRALPHLTASFGVASLLPGQTDLELIGHADAALYRAKQHGRNRVSL
jgi:diguanylate cyclase (GGDEF)-like protein